MMSDNPVVADSMMEIFFMFPPVRNFSPPLTTWTICLAPFNNTFMLRL